jgi:NADH-quinone oxidoreductase subunit N
VNLGSLLPQVVLLVGAACSLVTALVVARHRARVPTGVALGTLLVAALAQGALLGRADQFAMDRMWAADATTGVATIVVCGVAAVCLLLAPEWLATDARAGEYPAVLLLGVLGAIAMAGAADLNELVVAVTLSSVTGYVLAAYHRRSALSVEAGMGYFLIGGLSNLVLLLGVVLAFGAGGTTLYPELTVPGRLDAPWLVVPAGIALAVGLAFKTGAVPAHAWVPDVAQGAPLPSAAFLTVAPKIGGAIALSRLITVLPPSGGMRTAVATVAALSMTLGNLAALRQDDVRRLLGWSAVSQAGYALVAVAATGASDQAVPALLLFLATYAAGNLAAFAVVGALRGRTRLDDWRGLARSRPWLAWTMTIALLSLVGIPPLAGFAGKLGMFTAAVDAGLGWLAALAVVNTVVSLAYYLRIVAAMHLREPDGAPVHLLGPWSLGSTGVALAATVALGPLASVVTDVVAGSTLLS